MMRDGDYWRRRAGEADQQVDRLKTQVEGYEALLVRLTRERDQARAERDTANAQTARVISMCDRHAQDLHRLATEVERVATALSRKSSMSMYDRITLESLAILARITRERGATVDAAASRAAGGSPTEGSNPSAPTDPSSVLGHWNDNGQCGRCGTPWYCEAMRSAGAPGRAPTLVKYRTKTGKLLTSEDIERLAEEECRRHEAAEAAQTVETAPLTVKAPTVSPEVKEVIEKTVRAAIQEITERLRRQV